MITTNTDIGSLSSGLVPNVYIAKVVLDGNNTEINNKSLSLDVQCSLPVIVNTKESQTFYLDEKIRACMMIKIVVSCDRGQISFLKSLDSYQFCKVVDKFKDLYVVEVGLNELPGDLKSFQSEIINNTKIYNALFSRKLEVKKNNIDDATVFVVPFFNQKSIENIIVGSADLDNLIATGDIRKLYGKLIAEDVLRDGTTVKDGIYYEDQRGLIWAGEVQVVDGNIFKVSSLGLGGQLTERKTSNSVIQDYRVKKQIEDTFINLSDPINLFSSNKAGAANMPLNVPYTEADFSKDKKAHNPVYFSDLMTTTNKQGDLKLTFAANAKELFYQFSNYGKLWDNLMPSDKRNILSDEESMFQSMKLIRRRIESETNERLWNTFGKRPEREEFIAELYGNDSNPSGSLNISKVSLVDSPKQESNYFFFTGVDKTLSSRNYGFYQYEIKFVFEDRIERLLQSRLSLLTSLQKNLHSYYQIASNPVNYDLLSDRFSLAFASEVADEYTNLISNALANFIDSHQILFGGNYEAKEQMAKTLINISSPSTGTLRGLTMVLNLFDNLANRFANVLGINQGKTISDQKASYNPSSVKQAQKKHFVERKHLFKEVYDSKANNRKGYSFLEAFNEQLDETMGLVTINYSQYKNRVDLETRKYFNSSNGTVNVSVYDDNKNTGKIVSKDIERSKFIFLSPTSVQTTSAGAYQSLDENGVINYNNLNLAYLSILKQKLDDLDSTYKVSGKQFTNLSFEEKKQKYQLNEIFGLKGGSYITSDLEGITLFEMINSGKVQEVFSSFSMVEDQPTSDKEEISKDPPSQLDEPNFNDSLFFLNNVNQKGDISSFHSFIQAINGKYDQSKGQQKFLADAISKLIPNQYVHLLALNNTSNLSDPSRLKNILEVEGDPEAGTTNALQKSDTLQKSFGIWLNYFNIVAVEYLAGFINEETKEPYFRPLTADAFSSLRSNNQTVLCRMRNYYDNDFQIKEVKSLSLPTINKYFMLTPGELLSLTNTTGEVNNLADTIFKMSKHSTSLTTIPTLYVNSNMSTQNLISIQNTRQERAGRTRTPSQKTNSGGGGTGGGY
tara:strand:- start:6711 stop:9923 length:3213 start_codon:yes stop_codon:yes gene_type:complete